MSREGIFFLQLMVAKLAMSCKTALELVILSIPSHSAAIQPLRRHVFRCMAISRRFFLPLPVTQR